MARITSLTGGILASALGEASVSVHASGQDDGFGYGHAMTIPSTVQTNDLVLFYQATNYYADHTQPSAFRCIVGPVTSGINGNFGKWSIWAGVVGTDCSANDVIQVGTASDGSEGGQNNYSNIMVIYRASNGGSISYTPVFTNTSEGTATASPIAPSIGIPKNGLLIYAHGTDYGPGTTGGSLSTPPSGYTEIQDVDYVRASAMVAMREALASEGTSGTATGTIDGGVGHWHATHMLLTVDGVEDFSPLSLSNLVTWSRSDLGVVRAVNDITQWTDMSTQGVNFVSNGAPPDLVASDADINNHPYLNFNSGSSEYLWNTGAGFYDYYGNGSFTKHIVMRNPTNIGGRKLFTIADTTTWQSYYAWGPQDGGGSPIRLYWRNSGGGTTVDSVGTEAIWGSTWKILTTRVNGSNYQFYVNGVLDLSGTFTYGATFNVMTLGGAYSSGSFSNPMGVRVAEMVVAQKSQTDTEVNQVLNYFSSRYGISVTNL